MRTRLRAVAGIVVASASLVFITGASAGDPVTSLDLSPEALAQLTVQDGVKNFAGPASQCPGPEWDCTTPTAFPVVQTGTVNILVADADDCAGTTQTGTVNKLECVDEQKSGPFAHQTCGTAGAPIVQTGDHNELICKLVYDVTTTAPAQCVAQEALFEQTGTTNKFTALFRIVQQMHTSAGGTQIQDARQRIVGIQDAEEKNESNVEQVQIQKATGNAAVQQQNTGCTGVSGAPPAAGDCNPAAQGPGQPYTCLNLEQSVAEGGDNISKLKQEVKEDAQTSAVFATETQGTFDGGNDGAVHQEVGGDDVILSQVLEGDSGKSIGVADQYTYQTLPDRAGLVQSQFEDPSCCFESQFGGVGNEETINQVVAQFAGPDAFQHAEATGQSMTPSGKCTISHDLRNNGGSVDESETLSPSCPLLVIESSCTSGGGDEPGPLQVTGTCTSSSSTDPEPGPPFIG